MIALVIFDMDGLMLDSEKVALDIWLSHFSDQPERTATDIFLETLGWNWSNTIAHLDAHYPGIDAIKMCRQYKAMLIDHTRSEGVPLKPGLLELIDYLDRERIPKCVATSASRSSAEAILKKVEIYHRFGGHFYGDLVENGKPAPDLFLLAAKTMGVEPSNCVVLEDSPSGIRAAYAAGMIPIMVPDLLQPDTALRALIYRECKSLHEVAAVLAQVHQDLGERMGAKI